MNTMTRTPTHRKMRPQLLAALALVLTLLAPTAAAQDFNSIGDDGVMRLANRGAKKDSTSKKKDFPRGLKVWTVDDRFGDITPAVPDTASYMYMNTIFTTGMQGEYNTTGNLGAFRINRIFTDRPEHDDFIFDHGYDYFDKEVGDLHFTNTYSPVTNLSFNTCGNRTNGEDHFKALFATNVGKRIGLGFKFDYLYGRGYYQNNSASLFNYTLWGSYLGERYQGHLVVETNHQKQAENGGIVNDNHITHPEIFRDNYSENELPTMLNQNWNRNDNQMVFYPHRYSFGFSRDVPMTEEEIKAKKFALESAKENAAKQAKEAARRAAEKNDEEFDEEEYDRQVALNAENAPKEEVPADTSWTKSEYVPVTSLIHTVKFENSKRIYQAYYTPSNYYANTYATLGRYEGDSLYDKTRHYILENTFAVALLEGFNKYAKAGLKAFATHEFKHYTLPDSTTDARSYNEQSLFVGGQIAKTQGNTLHYSADAKVAVLGASLGDVFVDATADLNFPLLGDTVQLAADGYFHHYAPTFYYTKYHSRHLSWERTKTQLRVAYDNLSNYVYFGTSYDVNDEYQRLNNAAWARQCSDNISIFTASLEQQFAYKLLHLDAQLTYQKSSLERVIPVPALNVYANLYIRFKLAHVLDCDLGADVRYFTKYNAPDFVPGIAQYAVQENELSRTKVGNYPIINAYANFFLKHARFFVMMSHVNSPGDGGNYFLTPHYPLNTRILRFGVSWNFFN